MANAIDRERSRKRSRERSRQGCRRWIRNGLFPRRFRRRFLQMLQPLPGSTLSVLRCDPARLRSPSSLLLTDGLESLLLTTALSSLLWGTVTSWVFLVGHGCCLCALEGKFIYKPYQRSRGGRYMCDTLDLAVRKDVSCFVVGDIRWRARVQPAKFCAVAQW